MLVFMCFGGAVKLVQVVRIRSEELEKKKYGKYKKEKKKIKIYNKRIENKRTEQ